MKTQGQTMAPSGGTTLPGNTGPPASAAGTGQNPQMQQMMQQLGPAMMQQGSQQEALISRLAPVGPPPMPPTALGAPGMGGIGQTLAGYKQAMTPPRRPGQMTAGEMQTRPQVPGIGAAIGGGY